MRSLKYTLALASLGGLVAFASCTLITDVDRSKIPNPDASTPAEAGDSNVGGGGGAETGGTGGGSSGEAGAPSGGTGGTGGEISNEGGSAGADTSDAGNAGSTI